MKKIDLSPLPLKKNGEYDWENSIGIKLTFQYEEIIGEIEIIDYKKKKNRVRIKYGDKTKLYNSAKIIYCSFSDILENKNSYRFIEGEEIKGFTIITPLLQKSIRCYEVECECCRNHFIIEQTKLINVKNPRCKFCNKGGNTK